jgi:hypothetical protein
MPVVVGVGAVAHAGKKAHPGQIEYRDILHMRLLSDEGRIGLYE